MRVPTDCVPSAWVPTDVAIYGLDIETDTAVDGLDPLVAAIVAVAVAGPEGTSVFRGDERSLLRELARHLGGLAPGVITTWNGTSFDLPFVSQRATRMGVEIGLEIALGATSWLGHRHLDGYRLYRSDVARALPVSCGLKAMARLVGLDPVEIDVEHLHELDPALVDRYVASDAEMARALLIRRWPTAAMWVDPVSVG